MNVDQTTSNFTEGIWRFLKFLQVKRPEISGQILRSLLLGQFTGLKILARHNHIVRGLGGVSVGGSRPSPCHRVVSVDKKPYPTLSLSTQV